MVRPKSWIKKAMHSAGIKHADDVIGFMSLRRLILMACLVSLVIVSFSSWLFYRDPRSKYDLVRPGRRELPESFRGSEGGQSSKDLSESDVKLRWQQLNGDLNGLNIYGDFNSDILSDGKVLQNYLDQPVVE